MLKGELSARSPITEARVVLMASIRRYSGPEVQDAFEGYKSAVLEVIKDEREADNQVWQMAKGVKVSARLRNDRATLAYLDEVLIDYGPKNENRNRIDPTL